MSKNSVMRNFCKFFGCGNSKAKLSPQKENCVPEMRQNQIDEENRRNQIVADLVRASCPW